MPDPPSSTRRRTPRWVIASFVLAVVSFVLWPLGIVVLVIGIVALANGHIRPGVILVVLSIVLPITGSVVVQRWLVKPYRIPSANMVPALDVGDRILVARWDKGTVGDIVVFHPPRSAQSSSECLAPQKRGQPCPRPSGGRADVNFIKRIVAGPGDTLAIAGGHAILNGKRLDEPLVGDCDDEGAGCDFPTAITIPPDHYFMMGDNRGASDDSRFWGPVPGDWIVGRAFFRYFPFGDAGGL